MARQTGKPPDDLNNPIPDDLAYIWKLYSSVKLGCDNVTHESINAYLNTTRLSINSFELECILLIDKERIKVFNND